MRVLKSMFLTAAVLVSSASFADQNSASGSVDRLVYEAQELFNVVQYHPLRYEVKDSVFRFSQDTRQLDQCSRQMNPGHPGCARECRGYLFQAQRNFYTVERYLRDTYYEMPQVYRAYMEVREALDAVLASANNSNPYPNPNPYPTPYPTPNPYPHPHPGPGHHNPNPFPGPGGMGRMLVCIAVDNGWEEHSGGHRGFGRFIQEAQGSALQQCQQVHGSCRILRCEQQ